MADHQYFKNKIFKLGKSPAEFDALAVELFQYQARNNSIYRAYLKALGVEQNKVRTVGEIPFLPIEFFKNFKVQTGTEKASLVFTSSGTTGSKTSHHYVPDVSLYTQSFLSGFEIFYGSPEKYCILALLPSYLERKGSSLVYMTDALIKASGDRDSGFYLDDLERLSGVLQKKRSEGKCALLLGVTFALLDLAEKFPASLSGVTIMETGGMKGRRKEMIRQEVHNILKKAFTVKTIHSEYGMTELLSQAYSYGDGLFYAPPWMKVRIRDIDDPFGFSPWGKTGGVNVIDLANICSCAFIETQDLGRVYENDAFEIMGRFDNSDIRGCNLMVV